MAIIQLRDTWDAFLHAKEEDSWNFYHPDVEVLLMPTAMGAKGLEAYKKWYTRYMEPCLSEGLLKKRRVIKTHFAMDSVIEETIMDIHFCPGKESCFSWLIPGVQFVNDNNQAKISVVFISIHNFSQHPFQIRRKHVYWDQGSVLKQLNLLQTAVSKPPQYAFLPDFVLPLLKEDPETFFQNDASLNDLATRYDAYTPMPKQKTSESLHSNGTSDSNLFSDETPAHALPPPRTQVRVNYAAAVADKSSKIFVPETLPVHSFSGITVHPKKFEQHAAVIGTDRPVTESRPKSSSTSPRFSLFDPVTGDAPIPKVYDPLYHDRHISVIEPLGSEVSSPSKEPVGTQRKDQKSNFELKFDELAPSVVTGPPEKTRLKPKPTNVPSHFESRLSTQSMEDTVSDPSPILEKKKSVPPHLFTSIACTGIGMDETKASGIPKLMDPNEETRLEDITEADLKKEMRLSSPPKHLLESVVPPNPPRTMRYDMETTFDKPEKPIKKGYKKDLTSHIFDPLPLPTPTNPNYLALSSKAQANVFSWAASSDPNTTNTMEDQQMIPKKTKAHLESVVFSKAFNQVQLPKKQLSELRAKEDQIVFGDDGGTTGLPAQAPKWVVSAGKPKNKRVPSGGRTTIQLG